MDEREQQLKPLLVLRFLQPLGCLKAALLCPELHPWRVPLLPSIEAIRVAFGRSPDYQTMGSLPKKFARLKHWGATLLRFALVQILVQLVTVLSGLIIVRTLP